jgi:hypothetical protein
MALYARREAARLDQQGAAELLAGEVLFGDPPCITAVPEAAPGAISETVDQR